ncbi:MAG: hypothetical protein ACTSYU_03470, partial [Promethearchaeota archaeon]
SASWSVQWCVPSFNFSIRVVVFGRFSSQDLLQKLAPFRIGYLHHYWWPYPPDYKAAFAFSCILCPPNYPPPLRSGYHLIYKWGP